MAPVSTTEIFPAPILQPFVRCYTLRTFNTGKEIMPRPLYALHEFYFTFYLKNKFCFIHDHSKNISANWSNCIYSLFTEATDCAYFKGDYIMFCVQFKPNGFFNIFGIPQKYLTNALLPIDDILGKETPQLVEQLEESKDIYEMGVCMNGYLVKKLLKQTHSASTITIAEITNIIYRNKGLVSMDSLAHSANMSLRTFERKFVYEIGMSPKLLARIRRFNHALEYKMFYPGKTWTEITYECGYFDQTHLIKEFKEFSSKTPEELLKHTPPPTENYNTRAEP